MARRLEKLSGSIGSLFEWSMDKGGRFLKAGFSIFIHSP